MTHPIAKPEAAQTPRFRDAYENLLEEFEHVRPDELIAMSVDVPTAVTTVLGAIPEIRALRPQIVAELPRLDIARFDKLEAYALATAHAHALFLGASEPRESMERLVQGGISIREVIVADATALAQRRLIDGHRLRELRGVNGYRNLAFDLFVLSAIMREAWPKIAGATALELVELDQAELIADKLLTAVGQREQGPAVAAAYAESRQRAFTLLVAAYEEARRAIAFLRWHQGDAEEIAPSLYENGGRPERSSDAPPAQVRPMAARGIAAPEVDPARTATAGPPLPPIGLGYPGGGSFMR
jgi:hypothetical protein